MLKSENQLIKGLTAVQLLAFIQAETESKSKVILTLDLLGKADHLTYTSIRYCEENKLIAMHPTSNKAYAFNITDKGLKYLNREMETNI